MNDDMSAFGPKQTSLAALHMSAIGVKPDKKLFYWRHDTAYLSRQAVKPTCQSECRQTIAFLWLPSARLAPPLARFCLFFLVGGREPRRKLSKDYLRVGRHSGHSADRTHPLSVGSSLLPMIC